MLYDSSLSTSLNLEILFSCHIFLILQFVIIAISRSLRAFKNYLRPDLTCLKAPRLKKESLISKKEQRVCSLHFSAVFPKKVICLLYYAQNQGCSHMGVGRDAAPPSIYLLGTFYIPTIDSVIKKRANTLVLSL